MRVHVVAEVGYYGQVRDEGRSLAHLLQQGLSAAAEQWPQFSSHPTLIGDSREDALASVLRAFVPRRYEVLSGAIALPEPNSDGRASEQVDTIIADTWAFPTLARRGNRALVLPDAVHCLVEVKSSLSNPVFDDATRLRRRSKRSDLLSALRQVGALADARWKARPDVLTVVYAFAGPRRPATLRCWLKNVLTHRNRQAKGLARGKLKPDARLLAERDVGALSAGALPSLILMHRGLIAEKVMGHPDYGDAYRFYDGAPLAKLILAVLATLLRPSAYPTVDPAATIMLLRTQGAMASLLGASDNGSRACEPLPLL